VIALDIPGVGALRLEHLVLDFNGTLARDGVLLEGVAPRLRELAGRLALHVVTADTFGRARAALGGLPLTLEILPTGGEADAKAAWIDKLGRDGCAAMGNGANDALMLERAAISIAVVGPEGAASGAVRSAKIVVGDPCVGLDLLLEPRRLVATLRR